MPALVRLGVHDSLHPAVRGLHIDVLAERQAAKGATSLESLAGEVVGVHKMLHMMLICCCLQALTVLHVAHRSKVC